MQIGVVFPQTEIGADVGPIKAYAQAAEELGYHHLLAYDHVVGADPEVHAPWDGPYDIDTTFHLGGATYRQAGTVIGVIEGEP